MYQTTLEKNEKQIVLIDLCHQTHLISYRTGQINLFCGLLERDQCNAVVLMRNACDSNNSCSV